MGSRGKKSTAEKTDSKPVAAVVDLPVLGPPPPPDDITHEESARWGEVVAAYPADRWKPSDLVLLRDMIICERYSAECEDAITTEGLMVENRFGDMTENPAVSVREKMGRQILAIQRALRLSPSTRTRPDSAKARPSKGGGKKPWAK